MSYLTAQLSLFEVKFDGKMFPKSADHLLGKEGTHVAKTRNEWLALVAAMEANFGPAKPSKYKTKKRKAPS